MEDKIKDLEKIIFAQQEYLDVVKKWIDRQEKINQLITKSLQEITKIK